MNGRKDDFEGYLDEAEVGENSHLQTTLRVRVSLGTRLVCGRPAMHLYITHALYF